MGTLSQIAKIAKSYLPSEKRKRSTQKAKAKGIASFRDMQLSKALKAGKVTKEQQKAVDRHRGKPGGAPKKKVDATPTPKPKKGLARAVQNVGTVNTILKDIRGGK